eukprot:3745106-Prymnesium_polylepis.1
MAGSTAGELQLTTGDLSSSGSLLLPVASLNTSSLGHRHFRATFQLRIFDGSGADGFSLSYGYLPSAAVGEQGGGFGLRVSFLTGARCAPPRITAACPVLVVRYADQLLQGVPMSSEFRSADYTRTTVEYSAAGLFVQHGATVYVPRGSMAIDEWAPAAGWSFGFGARSGLQTDVHSMRALRIELGALVDPSDVPLAVSLNSQQFEPITPFTFYGGEERARRACAVCASSFARVCAVCALFAATLIPCHVRL